MLNIINYRLNTKSNIFIYVIYSKINSYELKNNLKDIKLFYFIISTVSIVFIIITFLVKYLKIMELLLYL